jgi:hypothetical protein
MNILDFAINYPDEESCRKKFKEQRDQMGVTCRHCNCKEHYWLENKQAYECKRCRARQTLRSGTVMQHLLPEIKSQYSENGNKTTAKMVTIVQ